MQSPHWIQLAQDNIQWWASQEHDNGTCGSIKGSKSD
jgi:hypothetical protein